MPARQIQKRLLTSISVSGIGTVITDVFPGTRKMKRKEKPLKKTCQNPVECARRVTQYNFRTRLELNLFSGHVDKAVTVLARRYAHSSCARMTRGVQQFDQYD